MSVDQRRTLYLGPPGTGKTFCLIELVSKALDEGIPPERIAFLSFTRSGAKEAKERAVERFNLKEARFVYFRTLHSLAYLQLSLGRGMVMGNKDYRELGEELNLKLSGNYADDGEEGQLIKFIEEQHRTRKVPLEKALRLVAPDSDITEHRMRQYKATLDAYKEERGTLDFTGMIERATKNATPLDVDLFIVDEAQDLTPLEWDYIKALRSNAGKVYYAGDDDQAIHAWSGSCIKSFLTLDVHETHVLNKSYRIPEAVYSYADTIVRHIRQRYKKTWSPKKEKGLVQAVDFFEIPSIDMSKESWFLLARNVRFLTAYVQVLKEQGHIFIQHNGKTYLENYFKQIYYWERLRKGKLLTGDKVKAIYKCLNVDSTVANCISPGTRYSMTCLKNEFGLITADAPWYDVFTVLSQEERVYLQRCLRNGENFFSPRIKVSTMHSVKGAEADNVVCLSDMSHPTNMEFLRSPDNEHRVFYVGATRAKKRLINITPNTPRFYEV